VAVAATYGVLVASHFVFGQFFGLLAVCLLRGAGLWMLDIARTIRDRRSVAGETSAYAGPVLRAKALEVAQR
jgi:hypothetical protein